MNKGFKIYRSFPPSATAGELKEWLNKVKERTTLEDCFLEEGGGMRVVLNYIPQSVLKKRAREIKEAAMRDRAKNYRSMIADQPIELQR